MAEEKFQKAYFGAGCFWGVEDSFKKTDGVVDTTVGFMGGNMDNPSYKQVCANNTGHAETVEVTYNPDVITYEELLSRFWEIHDPTQLNRQGPDNGSQYRSVVFYADQNQKEKARASKEKMESKGLYKDSIVTEIVPTDEFYRAEEYHQDYYDKNKQ